MGERVKNVYVMWDMKKCLCDGRDMRERGLCHEGYEKMFM